MAVPSLSELTTITATEIEELKMPDVRGLLSIDERAIQGGGIRHNTEYFVYEDFTFSIHYQNCFEGQVEQAAQLVLSVEPRTPAEYNLLYQLRVRVGQKNAQETNVVDRHMVEFKPHGKPLAIGIPDKRVRFVKLELRTVNKLFLPHPQLQEGDVTMLFADGNKMRTWKALLILASPYMAQALANPKHDTAYFDQFPQDAIKELLLQLYLPRHSVDREFVNLSKAAVSYEFNAIIYKLGKTLVDTSEYSMSMEEKWKLALKTELVFAFQELIREAIINGYWDQKQREERWNPVQYFSPAIYDMYVRPVVDVVRPDDATSPHFLFDPWIQPDYFKSGQYKVQLFFRGTPFYVNKGVLQLQGLDAFQEKPDGSLTAIFTKEMEVICGKTKVVPGVMLIALLNSLHPGGPPVEAQYLRGAIAFASTHRWTVVKEELEQRLLLEPPMTAQHFQQQLMFAERFHLQNMLRSCFFRAEGAFNGFATQLAKDGFDGLSPATKNVLVDRLCAGWAIYPKIVNKLTVRKGTEQMKREVTLEKGGPADTDQDVLTMAEVLSDYVYGPLTEFYKEEDAMLI